jgi:hypothetical protein
MSDRITRQHSRARQNRVGRPPVGSHASCVPATPTCTMPAMLSNGSPAEIFALFDPDLSGAYFGPLDPFVVRTALTLLTRIIGLPLAAIDLLPPRFSSEFPKHQMSDAVRKVLGPQMPRYHSWRRIILDAQMLATRNSVDQDPWDGLRRAARLTMGTPASAALHAAERHLLGTAPDGLTLARAIEVEARLALTQRQSFRRAGPCGRHRSPASTLRPAPASRPRSGPSAAATPPCCRRRQ